MSLVVSVPISMSSLYVLAQVAVDHIQIPPCEQGQPQKCIAQLDDPSHPAADAIDSEEVNVVRVDTEDVDVVRVDSEEVDVVRVDSVKEKLGAQEEVKAFTDLNSLVHIIVKISLSKQKEDMSWEIYNFFSRETFNSCLPSLCRSYGQSCMANVLLCINDRTLH